MIYPRNAVKAAYETAMKLYPTREAAISAVARELCIDPATVEAALEEETEQ